MKNSETSRVILKFPTQRPEREKGESGELAEKRGGREGRCVWLAHLNSECPVGCLVKMSSPLSECQRYGCGLTSSVISETKIVNSAGLALDGSLKDYRLQSTRLGRDLGTHSSSVQKGNQRSGEVG